MDDESAQWPSSTRRTKGPSTLDSMARRTGSAIPVGAELRLDGTRLRSLRDRDVHEVGEQAPSRSARAAASPNDEERGVISSGEFRAPPRTPRTDRIAQHAVRRVTPLRLGSHHHLRDPLSPKDFPDQAALAGPVRGRHRDHAPAPDGARSGAVLNVASSSSRPTSGRFDRSTASRTAVSSPVVHEDRDGLARFMGNGPACSVASSVRGARARTGARTAPAASLAHDARPCWWCRPSRKYAERFSVPTSAAKTCRG